MRRIVIGDVHGCAKELDALLERIAPSKEDELLFLGDYTDRGPNSYQVWKILESLKESLGERCILLKGNHEEFVLQAIKYHNDRPLWYMNGGRATESSFYQESPISCLSEKERVAYTEFLEAKLQLFYQCDDFLAVHGGLVPNLPLEETDENTLLWDRTSCRTASYNEKLCFVGHTPVQTPTLSVKGMFHPYYEEDGAFLLPKEGLFGLDTGCFQTGNLHAAIIEEGVVRLLRVSRDYLLRQSTKYLRH